MLKLIEITEEEAKRDFPNAFIFDIEEGETTVKGEQGLKIEEIDLEKLTCEVSNTFLLGVGKKRKYAVKYNYVATR